MAGVLDPWQPHTILRFIRALPTGAAAVRVQTDAGEAFLKAINSPAGPHALACEWVATHLARRLGLSTFDFALLDVTEHDELPLAGGVLALPGPAFVTRAERGKNWGGKKRELSLLANPRDISRLVVLDTWTLNCDRYRPEPLRCNRDNVFLSRQGAPRGKFVLKAMDHTHCFTCGRDLTGRLADLEQVRDERVYGLFPEFWPYLERDEVRRAASDLLTVGREEVQAIVRSIPAAWDVSNSAATALVELIHRRAYYVAETIMDRIWPQREFDFRSAEDTR